jgi:aquaporin Z
LSRRATNQALKSEAIHDVAVQLWPKTLGALASLRLHWPEYLMEAGELGLYMFLTCVLATLFRHPASPVSHVVMDELARRLFIGLATGAIVIAIVLTPWGKQSGGHFNPAITFTFYRLGKVDTWDAVFYGVAQFTGAVVGVALAVYLLRSAPVHDQVRYAMTVPGRFGTLAAFIAELAISFVLMMTILYTTNHRALARFTPYFVGAQYALYITFETPLSGMSMNPARTFAPAFHAGYWHASWIYFVAPTLGMLVAAEVFRRCRPRVPACCAKLYHAPDKRCIFRDCWNCTNIDSRSRNHDRS